jgi:hypothetical protein
MLGGGWEHELLNKEILGVVNDATTPKFMR